MLKKQQKSGKIKSMLQPETALNHLLLNNVRVGTLKIGVSYVYYRKKRKTITSPIQECQTYIKPKATGNPPLLHVRTLKRT